MDYKLAWEKLKESYQSDFDLSVQIIVNDKQPEDLRNAALSVRNQSANEIKRMERIEKKVTELFPRLTPEKG